MRSTVRPTWNRIPSVIGPKPRSKAVRIGASLSRFQLNAAATITTVEGSNTATSALTPHNRPQPRP